MNSFLFGWLTAFCVMGFMQDYQGLESYIDYVRTHWVDITPWFWVTLWSAIALALTFKEEEEK